MHKPLGILYQDDGLIIIDKPSGILVIPCPQKKFQTLTDLVNAQFHSMNGRWHPCHRLDRETSGAIVFACGKRNQQKVMKQFQEQSVRKKYIAFVKGEIRQTKGRIEHPVKDSFQKKFAHNSRGRKALTEFRLIRAKALYSVVEVTPITGRTNQVRIHFSEIGHPLLGERIYAFRKDFVLDFKRLALHASELSLWHPLHNSPIEVKSDMPQDMVEFLGKN